MKLAPMAVGPAIALGLACAVAAAWALSATARPSKFVGRMVAVENDVGEVRRLSAAAGDAAAYPRGALCGQSPEEAAQPLRQRILTAAAAANLPPPSVEVEPRSLDFEHGLPSVALKIEASGRYDALIGMLGRLASDQPTIFLDTLDLQPRVSIVNLKLNGHLFCRTSAASRS